MSKKGSSLTFISLGPENSYGSVSNDGESSPLMPFHQSCVNFCANKLLCPHCLSIRSCCNQSCSSPLWMIAHIHLEHASVSHSKMERKGKWNTVCCGGSSSQRSGVSTKQIWGELQVALNPPGHLVSQDPCHVTPAPKTSLHWVLTQGNGTLRETEIVRCILKQLYLSSYQETPRSL